MVLALKHHSIVCSSLVKRVGHDETGHAAPPLCTPLMKRTERLAQHSADIVANIAHREAVVADNRKRIEEERNARKVLQQGKDALRTVQKQASKTQWAFGKLQRFEVDALRSVGAVAYQESMKQTVKELAEVRRVERITVDRTMDSFETKTIRRYLRGTKY